MTLIEQLSNGEVYVKNDCTSEEMLKILNIAFPKFEYDISEMKFIYEESNQCAGANRFTGWVQFYEEEPEYSKAISAKEFLNEINQTK